jgi:hypothetical protein
MSDPDCPNVRAVQNLSFEAAKAFMDSVVDLDLSIAESLAAIEGMMCALLLSISLTMENENHQEYARQIMETMTDLIVKDIDELLLEVKAREWRV